MQAKAIVGHVYVFKDGYSGLLSGLKRSFVNHFFLKTGKEGFNIGIIKASTRCSEAGPNALTVKFTLKGVTGILATSITVMD